MFRLMSLHNDYTLFRLIMTGNIVAGKNNGGSRTDSVSGAGYIITTDNNNNTLEERSFKLPDYCTIYQRELIAIIESCKFLSTHTNTNIIILWSDSLSSIQATSSLSTKNRTTRDCYDTDQRQSRQTN